MLEKKGGGGYIFGEKVELFKSCRLLYHVNPSTPVFYLALPRSSFIKAIKLETKAHKLSYSNKIFEHQVGNLRAKMSKFDKELKVSNS